MIHSLTKPRRIVCAAVRLKDGRVVCGVRHFDQIMRQSLDGTIDQIKGSEQGFVDNHYRFLSRGEAYNLAVETRQLDPSAFGYQGIKGTLFSEDLW